MQLPLTPQEKAAAENTTLLRQIEKRGKNEDDVFRPCLSLYLDQVKVVSDPVDYLKNLSKPLIEARDPTEALIVAKFQKQWGNDSARVGSSVANSKRRSAGTNFQSLVAYALAKYLVAANSAWVVRSSVSKEFAASIAVKLGPSFEDESPDPDGAIASTLTNESVGEPEFGSVRRSIDPTGAQDGEGSSDGEDKDQGPKSVDPDIDLLLVNAAWPGGRGEPVLLLSVKTSIIDRGSMAARWKLYFDLATNPCPHQDKEGCAYCRLGISIEDPGRYRIQHGIVTANIYKYWYHVERYKRGELITRQTESTTSAFTLKLTTRDDDIAVTPRDWRQFPAVVNELRRLSRQHGLPQ